MTSTSCCVLRAVVTRPIPAKPDFAEIDFIPELCEGKQSFQIRNVDTGEFAEFDNTAKNCVDLEPAPRFEILQHGGPVIADALRTSQASLHWNPEGDTQLGSDCCGLCHEPHHVITRSLILTNLPHRCVR